MKLSYKKISTIFQILLFAWLPSQAQSINLNSSSEGGNSDFSGELLESSCAKIGVVMFHGRGSFPAGPVVDEMRKSLNRAGYSTLSIANPKPLNGLTGFSDYVNDVSTDNYVFPEAYARMRTAINYLQTLGVEQVVVAGFSLGSRFSVAHVARGQLNELPIVGLIGVGMYTSGGDPLDTSQTLDEITVPVLDLYGDEDNPAALTSSARQSAYDSGEGSSYTQTALTCNGSSNCHQLLGIKGNDSQPFEIAINAWMQSFAPAAVVTGCTPTVSGGGGSSGSLNLSFMGLVLAVLSFGYRNRRKA